MTFVIGIINPLAFRLTSRPIHELPRPTGWRGFCAYRRPLLRLQKAWQPVSRRSWGGLPTLGMQSPVNQRV